MNIDRVYHMLKRYCIFQKYKYPHIRMNLTNNSWNTFLPSEILPWIIFASILYTKTHHPLLHLIFQTSLMTFSNTSPNLTSFHQQYFIPPSCAMLATERTTSRCENERKDAEANLAKLWRFFPSIISTRVDVKYTYLHLLRGSSRDV